MRSLIGLMLVLMLAPAWGEQTTNPNTSNNTTDADVANAINNLDEPMYNPFIERYLLDEVRSLRQEMMNFRVEYSDKLNAKQLELATQSVTYSIDTITYFFYLIAGVTSLLVVVGYANIRDIKEKAHTYADREVTKLVSSYEKRLKALEQNLKEKTQVIEENREEIERTNEIHSLWLRASQETSAQGKIQVYDQILALRPFDTEALTYKADAALDLDETQWAISLSEQALDIDPEHGHAYYQMACAYAQQNDVKVALEYLEKAIGLAPSYRDEARTDASFKELRPLQEFKALTEVDAEGSAPAS
ncbi:TPR end-of-group domain-containing protein [Saccharospirillum mangrovi]|uniref:TPR end-of-group domain-containing protein n=1 Tax=Saccharospirillum mangrovi TaxID=2161747 RepID=UPI000D373B24|nr:tetratricopeptide repeat protein [Saccharospirillum mangrovi]